MTILCRKINLGSNVQKQKTFPLILKTHMVALLASFNANSFQCTFFLSSLRSYFSLFQISLFHYITLWHTFLSPSKQLGCCETNVMWWVNIDWSIDWLIVDDSHTPTSSWSKSRTCLWELVLFLLLCGSWGSNLIISNIFLNEPPCKPLHSIF